MNGKMIPKYYYILDNHAAVEAKNMVEFISCQLKQDSLVALAEFEWGRVSTVFLGRNHNYDPTGEPLVFETMIFGCGELDGTIFRYSTWDEAFLNHNAICQVLIEGYYSNLTSEQLVIKVSQYILAGEETNKI